MDARPHHAVEQEVPHEAWVLRGLPHAENEVRVEPQLSGGHGSAPRVVRLDASDGGHAVVSPGQGLGQEELELPDLVPREVEGGEVVPLHEETQPQLLVEDVEAVDRGGEAAQLDPLPGQDRQGRGRQPGGWQVGHAPQETVGHLGDQVAS